MFRTLILILLLVSLPGAARADAAWDRAVADCNQRDNLDRRIRGCTKLIASGRLNNKDLSKALSERGFTYAHKGNLEQAIIDLSKAISLNPKNVWAYQNRAIAYGKKRKYGLAVADFTKLIKLKPDVSLAYRFRAFSYEKIGQPDKAIVDYRTLRDLPTASTGEAEAARKAIARLEDENDMPPGTSLLDEALKNRSKPTPRKKTGNAALDDYLAKKDKATADAFKELNRKIQEAAKGGGQTLTPKPKLAKPGKTVAADAKAALLRGAGHRKNGEFEKAIAEFTNAIELDPGYASAYNERAWTYLKWNKAAKGLADVNKAFTLKPKFANAHDTRGHIYEALGLKDAAIADYRMAVRLDPSRAYYRKQLTRLGVTP